MFCTFDIFRWPLNWILQLLCSPVGNQNFLSKTKLNFTTDWTPHGNEFICTFAGFKVSFPSRRHHGTLCLVLRPADLQISYIRPVVFSPVFLFQVVSLPLGVRLSDRRSPRPFLQKTPFVSVSSVMVVWSLRLCFFFTRPFTLIYSEMCREERHPSG